MDLHGPEEFSNPVPVLPPGVALCKGIPRAKWVTKNVTITDEAGMDVAKGVCQNVDPELVIDMDGKPLGDNRVAIQIAESLCEEIIPSAWRWSMHSWDIKLVFLNGVSLYDHDQTYIYNMALKASSRRPRKGIRSYESSRERVEPEVPPKKEFLLIPQSIVEVSTKACCEKNCCQHFPRGEILALRIQLHLRDGFYKRKKTLLEVHRQIHKDGAGKDRITLKAREVCPQAWWIIHGVSKATFYRYKEGANAGKQAEVHGNLGSKKPRMHTLQATATLRTLIVPDADKMPHKSRTLGSGEKVPAMVLPSAFRWSDQLEKINESNARLDLNPISVSGLSNIRRSSFPEFAPKARGDTFARCGQCDTYKQLRSACTPLSDSQETWTILLNTHIAGQRAHKELYYGNRHISEEFTDKMLCIIHDKMDHSKTASPHFSHKTKATESYMKMHVSVTGMIAHGHGDVRYAHYGVGIFPTDSNHTIASIAKLLRDLEELPKNSSRVLFSVEDKQSALTKALLNGSEICLDSLLLPTQEPLPARLLPPVLTLQLDNALGDNKNRYVFAFCSLLIYKGIFREVYINFLIVGHTHEDIDAFFGRWSSRLKTNSYSTLPRLMKSFMDVETHPVIPHFIEEVPDFKKYVHGYLDTGGDFLGGHSKAQQFKFYKDSIGWLLMEYKNLCTEKNWLPEHGRGIRLWSETEDGLPKVPNGSPRPLVPNPMKSVEDVKKGLNGFVAHWNKMSNDEQSGEFRRKNGGLEDYWKGVRAALDAPLQVRDTLLHGFWPESRITIDEIDKRKKDGTLREASAEDVPFVGRKRDRPRASFCVDCDTFEGHFIGVRPADGDSKPFWLARAVTNPNPDPGHMNMIKIQYWTPASDRHINMDTYAGWDTKQGNVWREEQEVHALWSSTDCILTAWKPCFREGTSGPRMAIPKPQIDIIKASVAAFTNNANNNESIAQG